MPWKEGKLTKAKIYSHKGNSVKVRLNDKTIKLKTKPSAGNIYLEHNPSMPPNVLHLQQL